MRRVSHHIFRRNHVFFPNLSIRSSTIRIALCAVLLTAFRFVVAQTPADSIALDVSKIKTFESMDHSVLILSLKKKSILDKQIPDLIFSDRINSNFSQKVPFDLIGNCIILKFLLFNGADSTERFYFTPGQYFESMRLFKAYADNVKESFAVLQNPLLDTKIPRGFEMISIGPKEKVWIFAKFNLLRTKSDYLSPKMVKEDFLPYLESSLLQRNSVINSFNYLIAGVLLMMIFYSVSVYIQSRSIEFIYYSVYATCIGTWLFLNSYLYGSNTSFNYFFESYLDFIIQITGYIFYLLFFRRFLDTSKNHPFLEKILSISNWIILFLLLSFGITYFLTDGFLLINFIEITTKQFLLIASIVFIVYGLIKKEPLMNYLVAGQCMLTFFSIICFLMVATSFRFSVSQDNIFNNPLLYYQIGLTLELVLFMAALSYKNNKDLIERLKEQGRLRLDNERKEFEKQVAVLEAKQQERNRISADMHDELGSGVTAIRLMSEIVKTKMKENTLPEIEKISHSANELLNKMNTIIWTMVSSNDTLENLVAYIRAYAVEFFESTPIDCHFKMPRLIPAKAISGEKRRNLFLALKEALNNVLKHSKATNVTIEIMVENKLKITITDDGIGINMEKIRKFGNGLHNMKKRIESIDGEFTIENKQGTKTIFELVL